MTEESAKGTAPSASPAQGWADKLSRIDGQWTQLEARIASAVLLSEIVALCAWISLKGLSAEYQTATQGEKNVSGLVFRGILGAIVLGLTAMRATRPKFKEGDAGHEAQVTRQNVVVSIAVVMGLASGRFWANVGVEYFENLLNWMQSASLLMLIGGLRGVATRLTLWLALLGASLATGNGKHINIDVVMRFLTPKMRVPVAVTGWIAAAVMCFTGAWGFFDHISIALFHVQPTVACADPSEKGPCLTPASEKVSRVLHDMGTDAFIIGRQLSLDVKSLPRVITGTKYNGYLPNSAWNAWVNEGNWTSHFPPEQVSGLLAPVDKPNELHIPAVSIPGGQEVRGLLIKDADLIFPFGLLMIALRFVVRSILALAGKVDVDPDSAHKDDDEHPDGLRRDGDPPHSAERV